MNKLEQIKEDFKSRNSFDELVTNEECKVSLENYNWLIEQAEKVERLEKEKEILVVENSGLKQSLTEMAKVDFICFVCGKSKESNECYCEDIEEF